MRWLNFFFKLNGYEDRIALKFYHGFKPEKNRDPHCYKFQIAVMGLNIFVDEEIISQINEILKGQRWDRDDRSWNLRVKNSLFKPQEQYEENRNGVKWESLPKNWVNIAFYIMKYLTCEGRLSMVYSYNFIILHQVINLGHQPPHHRLCISHFLWHSLFEMGERVKSGKLDVVAHHGLIKLIICQKLH